MQITPQNSLLQVLTGLLQPRLPQQPAGADPRGAGTAAGAAAQKRPLFAIPDLATLRQLAAGPPLARGSVLNILV